MTLQEELRSIHDEFVRRGGRVSDQADLIQRLEQIHLPDIITKVDSKVDLIPLLCYTSHTRDGKRYTMCLSRGKDEGIDTTIDRDVVDIRKGFAKLYVGSTDLTETTSVFDVIDKPPVIRHERVRAPIAIVARDAIVAFCMLYVVFAGFRAAYRDVANLFL